MSRMDEKQRMAIAYQTGSTNLLDVWERVKVGIKREGLHESVYWASDKRVPLDQVAHVLEQEALPHFRVQGERISVAFSAPPNGPEDLLYLASPEDVDWEGWSGPLREAGHVTQAFIVDCNYQRWQNEYDEWAYNNAGRPHEHLPRTSNNLPGPLEQQVIDTSKNPGRFKMCQGYIEVAASPMWLGEDFWARTGADRSILDTIEGLNIRQDGNLLRLAFPDTPFTSEDTSDQQNALRSALFPEQI